MAFHECERCLMREITPNLCSYHISAKEGFGEALEACRLEDLLTALSTPVQEVYLPAALSWVDSDTLHPT